MLVSVWQEALREDSHEADLAGLELSIECRGERGILVTVAGFSDRLPALVARVFAALAAISDPAQAASGTTMTMLREAMKRSLANYDLQVRAADVATGGFAVVGMCQCHLWKAVKFCFHSLIVFLKDSLIL